MTTIPQNLVYERWDTLPDILKEAIFSQEKADLLWRICEANHLSDDKIEIISVVVGDILLGFVHAEDLASEIANETQIDKRVAQIVSDEVNRKIFSPIKKELEEVYKPAEKSEAGDDDLDISSGAVDLRQPVDIGGFDNNKPSAGESTSQNGLESAEVERQTVEINGLTDSLRPATFDLEKENDNQTEEFEAPAVIHKETEIKPIASIKKSLGGLFGGSRFDQPSTDGNRQQEAVRAEVNIVSESRNLSEEPQISRTEKPKMRVVNYGDIQIEKPKDVFANIGSETKIDSNAGNIAENIENKEFTNGPINLPSVEKEEKEVGQIELKDMKREETANMPVYPEVITGMKEEIHPTGEEKMAAPASGGKVEIFPVTKEEKMFDLNLPAPKAVDEPIKIEKTGTMLKSRNQWRIKATPWIWEMERTAREKFHKA